MTEKTALKDLRRFIGSQRYKYYSIDVCTKKLQYPEVTVQDEVLHAFEHASSLYFNMDVVLREDLM
tara:strand:+ start:734 stop:931 length:198 start_codon:yes stop_codon:yes gene_type:complete